MLPGKDIQCLSFFLLIFLFFTLPSLEPEGLENLNGVKFIGLLLVKLYQQIISPQDIPSCNFAPSCSAFGFEAIQEYGIFWGILIISDRLQRCHPYVGKTQSYQRVSQGEYFYDPVKEYFYKN